MGGEIVAGADPASHRLQRDAVITIGVLLLVFAAFDDITTDNATSFPLEYTILAAAAMWVLFVAGRLLRSGERLLGGVSLVALAAALWGQRAVGPGGSWGRGAGFKPEYAALLAAYGWCAALSLTMLWRGRRNRAG